MSTADSSAGWQVIDLTRGVATGVVCLEGDRPAPVEAGVLARRQVITPAFDRACYFACMQKYDPMFFTKGVYPSGANRIQSLLIENFRDLTRGGMLLLLQLRTGEHMAVMPLAGRQTSAWFSSDEDKLMLNVGPLNGDAPQHPALPGPHPALAWATAPTVHQACWQVWQAAIDHPQIARSTRLRHEKHYPQIFEHLGWCSWEQYRKQIDETTLLQAIDGIEASDLPIRLVLIDDGHLHHHDDRLLSFHPDPAKFPHGWRSILGRRSNDRIRWFGLWLCFNGYWKGLASDGQWEPLAEHLELVGPDELMPRAGFDHAMAFYDAMIGTAREAGFDFVKVDDQAQNASHYTRTPQGVASSVDNAQALEAACARHMDGQINCMAHSNICAMNTRISAVTRCSEDYQANDAWRAKAHLHNSFANMLWLGPTVWGDHDMFHSSDRFAAHEMALSKALGGGPVCLSDAPADFAAQHVRPLCFEDGRLLRPLAPAAPLPDSVYVEPFAQAAAYRVVAPLSHGCAAVAMYNLTHPTVPVTGSVTASDHTHAAAMLPPGTDWPAPADGLLCYDWHTRTAVELDHAIAAPLPEFGCTLHLLCPIRHGWAIIGDPDKFLSPAAVKCCHVDEDELFLEAMEPTRVIIYSRLPIRPSSATGCTALSPCLYQLDVNLAFAVHRNR